MLDEQRRAQLDGIVLKMKQDGLGDADIQSVVDDFKSKYGSQAAPARAPQEGQGFLGSAYSGVKNVAGGLYQGLGEAASKIGSVNSADLKGLGILPESAPDFRTPGLSDVTAAVGKYGTAALGGLIGGLTEIAGTPVVGIQNLVQGKKPETLPEAARRVARGAANTAGFGASIGEAGGRAAPSAYAGGQAFGPAINLPYGAIQAGEGLSLAKEGVEEGDYAKAAQGAMQTASGAIGLGYGAKSLPSVLSSGKGAFINPEFKAEINDPAFSRSIPGVLSSPFKAAVEPGKAVSSLAAPILRPLASAISSGAEKLSEKQFKDVLNQKPAKRANDISREKKPVERVMAEEQMRNGGLAGKDKAELLDEMDDRVDAQAKVLSKALESSKAKVSLAEWRDRALAKAEAVLGNRGPDYDQAVDLIERTYGSYKGRFKGDIIPVKTLNDIKSGYFWSKGYNPMGTPTSNDAMRIMGNAADEIVNEAVPDVSIRAVNAHFGDLIRARDAVRDSMTRSVGGGRLSRLVVGGIASTMSENPLLKLLMGIGGAKMTDIVNSPTLKTGIAGALLKASGKRAPELDFSKDR